MPGNLRRSHDPYVFASLTLSLQAVIASSESVLHIFRATTHVGQLHGRRISGDVKALGLIGTATALVLLLVLANKVAQKRPVYTAVTAIIAFITAAGLFGAAARGSRAAQVNLSLSIVLLVFLAVAARHRVAKGASAKSAQTQVAPRRRERRSKRRPKSKADSPG